MKIAQKKNGIVHDKFKDSLNHNYYTVLLEPPLNKSYFLNSYVKYYLPVRYEKFSEKEVFDFIQIGDSLVKKKGSKELLIFRNQEKTKFILDYGCEGNRWRWFIK